MLDQSNTDYEQIKGQYPLRDNRGKEELSISPDPKRLISANDISAFGDDSMIDKTGGIESPSVNRKGANQNQFEEAEEYEEEGEGGHKTRFKEEEERFDLLKDIRMQQDL